MAIVYAWPPVLATSKTWNLDSPISRSYGMTTGKRFASAAGTPRRRATITVLGRRNNGLGHMAALERLLRGGINLVRLTSCRMAFGPVGEFGPLGRSGSYFSWRVDGTPPTEFGWTVPDDPFVWFEGAFISATINSGSGGYRITLTGQIPANSVIAIPGEFITIITAANPEGETHMVINTARSTAGPGQSVIIRLATPVSGPGRVNLNTFETGIFELNSDFPDLGRGADVPDFPLEFREIFPGEIAEGITESNPWT